MESKSKETKGSPPQLIASLTAGFNIVANNVYLLLFPALLDLFLWLGPHLRIKDLVIPWIEDIYKPLEAVQTAQLNDIAKLTQEMAVTIFERYNLLSGLRTLPIGIPSLMAGVSPITTPLGNPLFWDLNTLGSLLGSWVLIVLFGIIAGCLFFSEIARSGLQPRPIFSIKQFLNQCLQILLLSLAVIVLLLVIMVPSTFVLSLLSLIDARIMQAGILVLGFFVIWILLPLIFSPHGIFTYQQNALVAMLNSARLVRYFLPGTGLFLLTAVLISKGMDMLWLAPAETSWLAILGIAGHAFITSGLIAASFVYYRSGMQWVADNSGVVARPLIKKG